MFDTVPKLNRSFCQSTSNHNDSPSSAGNRARALLLREEEDRRSTAYREEATILARETSKEAERVASAVLGRRVEEEEQAIAEVGQEQTLELQRYTYVRSLIASD